MQEENLPQKNNSIWRNRILWTVGLYFLIGLIFFLFGHFLHYKATESPLIIFMWGLLLLMAFVIPIFLIPLIPIFLVYFYILKNIKIMSHKKLIILTFILFSLLLFVIPSCSKTLSSF
ncbi:MAG: hypothetical protein ACD_18C00231G0002 [uncultured bacterium]|nr:MAG: hypothetical protein ACD_18C00231G0002 [uncultured bacterium]OGH83593.1 MAG: hypothetical protein A2488_02955 [Candidatus Magasanikbacteria bacterium RIFOXYC12_FULL_32_21b]OGH91107.1 MAG: hypothetical protein A2507_04170 [Candidatus Magasanikbacteria bacterium RIFOXYD12_FULL_33_17]HAO52913.1 hypothetical protein [Candidatus Magasanikbacteria bacterium]